MRDDSNRGPKRGLLYVADILVVDLYRAAVDIVKTKQKPRNSRFSGPGRTDDRQGMSSRNGKADAFYNRASRIVSKYHRVKLNLAARYN